MKSKLIILYLLVFVTFCVVIWKTGDGFYVVLAYITLSALLIGIRKKLFNKLDA